MSKIRGSCRHGPTDSGSKIGYLENWSVFLNLIFCFRRTMCRLYRKSKWLGKKHHESPCNLSKRRLWEPCNDWENWRWIWADQWSYLLRAKEENGRLSMAIVHKERTESRWLYSKKETKHPDWYFWSWDWIANGWRELRAGQGVQELEEGLW